MGKTYLSDLWPRLGCLRPVLEVDAKAADHADIWRRAYLGHGDQLGALEAEAAAYAARRPRQTRAVWPPLGRMRKA